jgi:hypothetical protein
MSLSKNYYYDPVSNYKVDWSKSEYYLKEFKCNCMSRYIENKLSQNMIINAKIDEEIDNLFEVARENRKNMNLLNNMCDELCSGFQTLSVDYNMLNIQLHELKNN